MPLHDYECLCGKRFESYEPYENKIIPSQCCLDEEAMRVVSLGGIKAFGIQTFEDMDHDSVTCSSPEELARECHKRGLYSNQLMGSDRLERIMRGGH